MRAMIACIPCCKAVQKDYKHFASVLVLSTRLEHGPNNPQIQFRPQNKPTELFFVCHISGDEY